MQKSRIFIIVLIASAVFTSCRKEYTCECMDGWGGGPYEFAVKSTSQKGADKKCLSHNVPNADDAPYGCHLK